MSQPTILALDSSGAACSAALLHAGAVYRRDVLARREHTERLLPMIDEVLAEAKIALAAVSAIAFGCGPGAFTGLRIAAGVTQGLAFGAGLPVIPVSSLAALAQGWLAANPQADGTVAVAVDARMDEVYFGCYRCHQGLVVASQAEQLLAPEAVTIAADQPVLAALGSGWVYAQRFGGVPAALWQQAQCEVEVSAAALLPLACAAWAEGKTVSADKAQPVYLRNQVSWQKTSPGSKST